MDYPVVKSVACEFLGTFALVFFTLTLSSSLFSTLVAAENYIALSIFSVLILSPFIWLSQRLSGGFFNPSLTLSAMLFGGVSFKSGILAMSGQMAGGFVAMILLKVTAERPEAALDYRGLSFLQALFAELLFSLLISLAYFFASLSRNSPKNVFGFAISAGVAASVSVLPNLHFTGANLACLVPFAVLGMGDAYAGSLLGNVAGALLGGLLWKVCGESDADKFQTLPLMEEEIKF